MQKTIILGKRRIPMEKKGFWYIHDGLDFIQFKQGTYKEFINEFGTSREFFSSFTSCKENANDLFRGFKTNVSNSRAKIRGATRP